MSSLEWLLLTYKIAPEPARLRVSVWRKLKGMGAVYLQGGVCLLPKTDTSASVSTRAVSVLYCRVCLISGEVCEKVDGWYDSTLPAIDPQTRPTRPPKRSLCH